LAVKQTTLDDLVRQINRLIGTVNGLLERYARGYEELDSIRLAQEEFRELLIDHFAENARWADRLSERMDRVEQYTILAKFDNLSATIQIESAVSKEHIERSLQKQLVTQQNLWKQYQDNIDMIQEKIAKFGETVPRLNELADYEKKIAKIKEAMARIREALS